MPPRRAGRLNHTRDPTSAPTSGGGRTALVAGAGIAGLSAALALAAKGFAVTVHERSARLEEVGAGLQLSPNATRLLGRLGVLPRLMPEAVEPPAVILRSAGTLRELARVPLGAEAGRRWGAPYLVTHRADLQAALLGAAAAIPSISLRLGEGVVGTDPESGLAWVETRDGRQQHEAEIVIGADGVWSTLRGSVGARPSTFAGQIAWRATLRLDSAAGELWQGLAETGSVNAFLHPAFHLVGYPLRAGQAVNLVAFTDGERVQDLWEARLDAGALRTAARSSDGRLQDLFRAVDDWTAWPIHRVDARQPWTRGRLALIGDAAHAMTPFAAQGAAMAIEDAATLAEAVAGGDVPAALRRWEAERRARVRRVARRGALNHFTWRASGPVATARDLVLRFRPPHRLAADLDWLYGWRPPSAGETSSR